MSAHLLDAFPLSVPTDHALIIVKLLIQSPTRNPVLYCVIAVGQAADVRGFNDDRIAAVKATGVLPRYQLLWCIVGGFSVAMLR